MTDSDLAVALRKLERRQGRLSVVAALLGILVVVQGIGLVGFAQADPVAKGSLELQSLAIVDTAGVVRVRLSGDLPDAVIDGRRINRGERVAGVMLYDDTGQERGGYVTFSPSGNVALTLDTRREQAALFVADPVAGAALQLWNGEDRIELRSDPDGTRLTTVRDGQVVLQQPAATLRAEACSAYRDALEKMPRPEVAAACASRFTSEACASCLSPQ